MTKVEWVDYITKYGRHKGSHSLLLVVDNICMAELKQLRSGTWKVYITVDYWVYLFGFLDQPIVHLQFEQYRLLEKMYFSSLSRAQFALCAWIDSLEELEGEPVNRRNVFTYNPAPLRCHSWK